MKYFLALTTITALCLGGCSVLPYEEEFACQKDRSYGKCTSVEGAYNEAVTGVESGELIKKNGAVKSTAKEIKRERLKTEKQLAALNEKSEASTYQNYRAEMYDQLQALTAQPKTPMIKSAVEVRTLILSYSPSDKRDRLYMPRFIYSIHKPAEFVLGQYLLENEDDIDAMSGLVNSQQ